MKCSICGKPVVLVPSAEERAKKFGNSPSSFYRALFKTHADCALKKRADETKELIARINAVR